MKIALIRALATGEHTQVELATRYGVTQQSVSDFARRHAERIADVALKLEDRFAALWAADKVNRMAEYQQDIEDADALLADPETAARSGVAWAEVKRIKAQALRAVADEKGDIPARMQVEHSGALEVRLNGVDVGALR